MSLCEQLFEEILNRFINSWSLKGNIQFTSINNFGVDYCSFDNKRFEEKVRQHNTFTRLNDQSV